ncbi:MAG TPA: [protein-PII] uridylyltransferase [Mycobacteriales bacterium]|nr:[protein-PII] uridylyltransferase [Mycobacteriales bacterium]
MSELRGARREVLARGELAGATVRAALSDSADRFLAALLGGESGSEPDVALVAVGGYGRRELTPGSDLDVLLVHRDRRDVAALAERVWYPLWDSGVPLDHAVRTVAETAAVAAGDLRAALGLLDARHVAGDRALTEELRRRLLTEWRASAPRRLPDLVAAVRARWDRADELAFLVEPDLKEARGGLRDMGVLRALAAAWLAPGPGAPVRAAAARLLDVRTALHRITARGSDRLVHQEQSAVAAAVGLADADALLAEVAGAGRTIAYAVDVAFRQALRAVEPRGAGRRRASRRPLAAGVVAHDGEIVLARDAAPATDPVLVLRAAAAAAQAGLAFAPHTLTRLRAESPPLPEPWPEEARDALVTLLGAGPALVPVVEALDQAGLWEPVVPEWHTVRNRPQRSPVHRFTVDRHLVEAAAQAGLLARRVDRPDLLLLAALLHDLGKGAAGGDHAAAGAALTERVGRRLGLPPGDRATLVALIRHHLLLPHTATGRDLDDPATVRLVAAAVGDRTTLDLLYALTESDARATGPAAWTDWRAALVAELVRRTAERLAGAPPPPRPALDAEQQALVARGVADALVDPHRVTVVAPDRRGLLAASAGVLALHRLEVRSADAFPLAGQAVAVFRVAARFGGPPDPTLLAADLRRALAGASTLGERLAARDRACRPPPGLPPPAVFVLDDASESATVVEVRAHDAPGLLHRIAGALAGCGACVRAARVATLGAEVVDAFYVTDGRGAKLDPRASERVRRAVLAALDPGTATYGGEGGQREPASRSEAL